MKAGDIVAVQSNSCSSKLIRFFTQSEWSHVGMAVDANTVLEATKLSKEKIDGTEVRVLGLESFLNGRSKTKLLIRPQALTENEVIDLKIFFESVSRKRYNAFGAAMTAVIPLMGILLGAWFLNGFTNSLLDLIAGQVAPESISFFVVTSFFMFLFVFLIYELLVWSFRCRWGVEKFEKLFRKTTIGNWLVNRKHDTFCSKLVLLADKAVGGPLAEKLPNEDEVQPRHIVEACHGLGWVTTETIALKDIGGR